jgi:hypothetical protein
MDEPAVNFELQASELEGQRSLLGAITRFAFPATNRSLGLLRQCREERRGGREARQGQGQPQEAQPAQEQQQQEQQQPAPEPPAAAAEDWDQAESRQSNQFSSSQVCAAQQEVEQPVLRHSGSSTSLLAGQPLPAQQQAPRQRHRLHRQTYPDDSAHSHCDPSPRHHTAQPCSPVHPTASAPGPATSDHSQQQQQQQQQALSCLQTSAAQGSQRREEACLQRLQQSLVKDMLQYDE